MYEWSPVFVAPALLIIKETAFFIKCVTYWDLYTLMLLFLEQSSNHPIPKKTQNHQICSKKCTAQTQNLTKSRTWCEMQFLWCYIKWKHWEDSFTLNTLQLVISQFPTPLSDKVLDGGRRCCRPIQWRKWYYQIMGNDNTQRYFSLIKFRCQSIFAPKTRQGDMRWQLLN